MKTKQRKGIGILTLLSQLLLQYFPVGVAGTECYPRSKALLPKTIVYDNNGTAEADDEHFRTIVGSKTSSAPFVIYGGKQKEKYVVYDEEDKACVISRMDLDTHVVRWARSYDVDDKSKEVEGLSLNVDETKVAVFARKEHGGDFNVGNKEGFVFIIKASDGGQITRKARKIELLDNHDSTFLTSSSAMVWTTNDELIIAWWLSLVSGQDGFELDGGSTKYDSRLRIGKFHVQPQPGGDGPDDWEFDWVKEQEDYFGQSSALAYGGWSGYNGNIYLGGAADFSKWQDGDTTEEWAPIIYQLQDSDASKYKSYQLKINNAFFSAQGNHPMIDHLKIDKNDASVDYIFGSTRTRFVHGSGQDTEDNLYLFRLQTKSKSDHDFDETASNFLVARIDPNNNGASDKLSAGSFIAGILRG